MGGAARHLAAGFANLKWDDEMKDELMKSQTRPRAACHVDGGGDVIGSDGASDGKLPAPRMR